MWKSLLIPLSSCVSELATHEDEVIREMYMKLYFIMGDPSEYKDDIDTLIKKGLAIPVKARVLCKSEDFAEDSFACYEMTLTDDIIPL